jgi:hypothetical protein
MRNFLWTGFSEVTYIEATVPSSNVRYLEEEGPSPPESLPAQLTRNDREHGLSVVTLHGGRGDADSLGGRLTRIAYLPSHDCEIVLQAFLDANPQLPSEKTRRGLTSNSGRMVASGGRPHRLFSTTTTGLRKTVADVWIPVKPTTVHSVLNASERGRSPTILRRSVRTDILLI